MIWTNKASLIPDTMLLLLVSWNCGVARFTGRQRLLCPRSYRVGHNGLMAVVCLSVCLSSAWLLSRERKGIASWKIGRNEAMTRVTREWPHLEVESSNTCRGRAYCGGPITGCTPCLIDKMCVSLVSRVLISEWQSRKQLTRPFRLYVIESINI